MNSLLHAVGDGNSAAISELAHTLRGRGAVCDPLMMPAYAWNEQAARVSSINCRKSLTA